MRAVKLSRQKLYEQVWTTPLRLLAPTYGISDVGLAKACRRHGIPLPGPGYWTKLKHGVAQARPKLPPASGPSREQVRLNRLTTRGAPRKGPFAEIPVPPVGSALRHPLAIKTAQGFKGIRVVPWRLSSPPDGCLDIEVRDSNVERAVRFFDALLLALQEQGAAIEIIPNRGLEAGGTYVVRDGERVRVRIEQASGGRLALVIPWVFAERRRWCEKEQRPMEITLAEFANAVIAAVPIVREQRIKAEAAERAIAEAEAKARADELVRLAERRWRKAIFAESERMRRAGEIRDYAKALLERHPNDSAVRECADRARRLADKIDPLLAAPDSLKSVNPRPVRIRRR